MADQKKLDRWADKLLDTGKRNMIESQIIVIGR